MRPHQRGRVCLKRRLWEETAALRWPCLPQGQCQLLPLLPRRLPFPAAAVAIFLTLGPTADLPLASSEPVASCLAGATSPPSSSAKSGSQG